MRRTIEGEIVVKPSILNTIILVGTILSVLATGAIGATKFWIRAGDSVDKETFKEHLRRDSLKHAFQDTHDAFQDSLMSSQARDTHALICFIYKNPKPFCEAAGPFSPP